MPPPNGINPGKSQVNLTLSQQSVASFNELSAAINQAKADLLALKNQFQVFMGPNGLQDMKTLAGLMKQVSIGVNSIGASNRTTVSAQRNALFSTPQQTQGAMYANELKAAEKLLQAEKDRQVLQESMIRRRASAVQNITELETAQFRMEAAKVRLARDLEIGNHSTIASSRSYLNALEQQTQQLLEQEKIAARIRNQQAYKAAREAAGLGPQPLVPKTAAQIAQEQQDARLNKVQGILGDGGGAIFAVQAGLLANYQIMNGMAAAFKYAIQFSTELDAAFKELQAITGSTNTEMVDMRNNLLDVAQQSKFTATEVAQAAVVLGQAGLSVAQIKDAMQSITALAAASGTDLKKASDTLTGVMGAFDMSANQSKEIANTLTQALNVSKLDIEKLAMGIQYAGNTAQQTGVGFKEMTSILAALSNAGIRSGSTLGTGLRQIMIDIQKPTAKFQQVLDRLGLGLADVDIKSKGLTNVLQTLQDAGFSSADAFQSFEVRAAAAYNALSGNMGKVREMADALDRTDAVTKANAVQMDSFVAQSSRLKSNLGILISTALTPLINAFTGLTRVLGDITGNAAGFKLLAEFIGTTLAGALIGTAITQIGKLVIGLSTIIKGLMGFEAAAAVAAEGASVLKVAMVALAEAPLLAGGIIGAAVIGLGTLTYALLHNRDALSEAKDMEDKATASANQYRSALQDKQQSITNINGKIDELVSRQNSLKDSDGSLGREVKDVEAMFSKFGKTLDDNAKASVPNLIAALRNLRQELGLAESLAQLNQSLQTQNLSQRVTLKTVIDTANPGDFNPNHAYLNAFNQAGLDGMVSDTGNVNGIDRRGWSELTHGNSKDIASIASSFDAIRNYTKQPYTMDQVAAGITHSNALLIQLENQMLKAGDNGPEKQRISEAEGMVKRMLQFFQDVSDKNKEITANSLEQGDNRRKAAADDLTRNNHMPTTSPGAVGLAHQTDVINAYIKAKAKLDKPHTADNGVQMAAWMDDAMGLANASWDKAELLKSSQPNSKLKMFTANSAAAVQDAKQFMSYFGSFGAAEAKGYGEAYKRAQEVVDFVNQKRQEYKTKGEPLVRAAAAAQEKMLSSNIRDLEQQASTWTGDPKDIEALGRKARALLLKQYGVKVNEVAYEKNGDNGVQDAAVGIQINALKEDQKHALHDLDMKFAGYAKARREAIAKMRNQIKADHDNMVFKDETVQIDKYIKQINKDLTNRLKQINQPLTNLARQSQLMQDPRYSMLYSGTERELMAKRMRETDDSLNPARLAQVQSSLGQYQGRYNQASSEVSAMTADRATLIKKRDSISDTDILRFKEKKDLETQIDALTAKIVTREGEAADANSKIVDLKEKQVLLQEKIAQAHPAQEDWKQATLEGLKLTAKSWDENATLIDGLVGAFAKAKDATTSYFDTIFTSIDTYKKKYSSFGVFMREETKAMMSSVLKNVLHTLDQILAQKMLMAMLSAFGVGVGGGVGGEGSFSASAGTGSLRAIRGGLITNTGIRHMAGGGMINGPIRGQDSQLILGMPGEVVMNKSAVDAVGADTLMALNAMGNSQVSKSGERIQPIDETKRNRPVAHTNVWVVTPDQKPQMGPNDVIAVVSDDLTRGGSIKQLVKSVVSGY